MAHEIQLRDLTLNEWVRKTAKFPDEDWDNYKKLAVMFLYSKELHVYESDILKAHEEESMEPILERSPFRYFEAGKRNKYLKDFTMQDVIDREDEVRKIREERGGWKPEDYEKTWYDLVPDNYIITPDEIFYPDFLRYFLRTIEITDIDAFLEHNLTTHFDNDVPKFSRFIRLAIRKHADKIPTPYTQTIEEFLEMLEHRAVTKEEVEPGKTKKSKVTRVPGDGLTVLNLKQTAYLANLLRQAKVILKDEKLLPDSWMGEAFNTLTGYSEHTLRLNMNLKGQDDVNYNDRKAVRDLLHNLINKVNKEIEDERGNKSA